MSQILTNALTASALLLHILHEIIRRSSVSEWMEISLVTHPVAIGRGLDGVTNRDTLKTFKSHINRTWLGMIYAICELGFSRS